MPRIRTLTITGPFTDEALEGFIAVLRTIDAAVPTSLFVVSIIDEDGTMEEGEALLRRALPPIPERATEFARAAYRDPSYPMRVCDRCQQPYRGPAVYCSLDCALAAA